MSVSAAGIPILLTAATLLVPLGLSAQGHQEHHPPADSSRANGGMMHCGMMSRKDGSMSMRMGMMGTGMMQPGPDMLLRQREALGLSRGQVKELEELQARADELFSTHRSEMMPVRERLQELHAADDLDLDRYESLLREQADLRVEMQLRMAALRRDALGVLDEQQKSNFRYGMRMMQSMHERMHARDCPASAGSEGEG